jgi:hypothetical protein
MEPHRIGRYGLLDDSEPPDPFTTAGALYRAREDTGAPMPSFPEGSPAFAVPLPPTRPVSAASNVEVVPEAELAALCEAVPSASPLSIRVSMASLEAIHVAMPSPASLLSSVSSHDSFTEHQVPADSQRSSDEDDTPSAVPQQFGALPAVVRPPLLSAPRVTDAKGLAELLAPVARGGLSRDTVFTGSSHGSSSVTEAQWADVPGLTTIPDQGPVAAVSGCEDVAMAGESCSVNASPGDHPSVPIVLSADTRSPSVVVSHDVTYHTPPRLTLPETEIASSLPLVSPGNSLDQLIHDTVLAEARDAMDQCMDMVNVAHLGHAHYYLGEPLRMVPDDDPDITIPSENLRRVLDLAAGVIGVGPISTTGVDAGDLWHCLTPSSWFHVSTAMLASIVRSCVRSLNIHSKGDFPFEPCLDKVQYVPGVDTPTTQSNALRLLACQLLNELGRNACMADFSVEEAAQLHDAQFATFKAYVEAQTYHECTVMGNQVTHLTLLALVRAVAAEHTKEELEEIVCEDIHSCIRGQYPIKMCELEEKERRHVEAEHRARVEHDAQITFNVALARRIAELMPALEEQAQAKAHATAKPLVAKYAAAAMDREAHEANEQTKAHGKEHYATRATAMKLYWDQVIVNEEKDVFHSTAIALDIFPEVDPARVPHPAKKQRGEPRSVTTTKATERLRERAASPSGEKRKLDAPVAPALHALVVLPPAPSARPDQAAKDDFVPSSHPSAAEEDVSMRVLSLPPPELDASHLSDAHMDPQTRGLASSEHCLANAMVDDAIAASGLGISDATDDGAAPSPTNSTSLLDTPRLPTSTQDQAVEVAWDLLSQRVDRCCEAMEAKVVAAISHLTATAMTVRTPAAPALPTPPTRSVSFADPPCMCLTPPVTRCYDTTHFTHFSLYLSRVYYY